jgi:HD-like signal output (HDOD) protein
VIERDPGLTARVIGVANSAYFNTQAPIYDIATAVVRVLGLNLVKHLALGIALSAHFDTSGCPRFELDRYWYLAVQTATLATHLAPHARLEPGAQEYLFLGGLLHNMGELLLIHSFLEGMCEVLAQSDMDANASIPDLQEKILGLTGTEAAVVLGHKWHLPSRVVRIIANHDDPGYRGDGWRSVGLVGYCSQLINANYLGNGEWSEECILPGDNVLQLSEDKVVTALEHLSGNQDQVMALADILARNK